MSIAISAVQIWMCKALGRLPSKVLILRCCLSDNQAPDAAAPGKQPPSPARARPAQTRLGIHGPTAHRPEQSTHSFGVDRPALAPPRLGHPPHAVERIGGVKLDQPVTQGGLLGRGADRRVMECAPVQPQPPALLAHGQLVLRVNQGAAGLHTEGRAFFKPAQFHLQPADLLEQLTLPSRHGLRVAFLALAEHAG